MPARMERVQREHRVRAANQSRAAQFWGMLTDVLRFNRLATALARSAAAQALDMPIGEFLSHHRFGRAFRDWYFLPMIGASGRAGGPDAAVSRGHDDPLFATTTGCCRSPTAAVVHVARGARTYVDKMLASVPDARLRSPVRSTAQSGGRSARRVTVSTIGHGALRRRRVGLPQRPGAGDAGRSEFGESRVLGAIRYQPIAPYCTRTPRCCAAPIGLAAWNYERAAGDGRDEASVCCTICSPLQRCRSTRAWWCRSIRRANRRAQRARRFDTRIRCSTGPPSWRSSTWRDFKASATLVLRRVTRYGFHEDGLTSAGSL